VKQLQQSACCGELGDLLGHAELERKLTAAQTRVGEFEGLLAALQTRCAGLPPLGHAGSLRCSGGVALQVPLDCGSGRFLNIPPTRSTTT
jgi:hypothetical protein